MQSTPNLNSNNVIPVYGANSQPYREPPTDTQRENGVVPLDSLPAEWWNWLWYSTTMNLGEATQDFNILYTELVNLMTAAGITPSSSSAENVKDAVIVLTRAIGDATNPGAVKSSTASGKVAIASDGTCTVNGLGTPSLLDLGDDVVDAINQLNAAVGTVTSTVDGKNIKITYTHNNALSINDNSPVLQEVTSDTTNGIKYVFTTVASQFWSYIWGKIKTALGIGTNAKGGTKQPVYFAANGTVTATTETVGSANKPTYRNAGTETAVSDNSVLVNLASTTAASTYASAPRPGVTGTLPITNGGTGAATADAYKKAIIDIVYPVGSVFVAAGGSTPPTATGVTWQSISGYLWAGAYATFYVKVIGSGGSAKFIKVTLNRASTPDNNPNMGFTTSVVSSVPSPYTTYTYRDTSISTDAQYKAGAITFVTSWFKTNTDYKYFEHQLTIDEMPAHHHGFSTYAATCGWGSNGFWAQGSNTNTGDTGGDQPHMHPIPTYVVAAWRRTA